MQSCRNCIFTQVLNLEDELVRNSDIKSVLDLTKSKSLANFKSDFSNLKVNDCRIMLNKHKLNVGSLWNSKVPAEFSFIDNNSSRIKLMA